MREQAAVGLAPGCSEPGLARRTARRHLTVEGPPSTPWDRTLSAPSPRTQGLAVRAVIRPHRAAAVPHSIVHVRDCACLLPNGTLIVSWEFRGVKRAAGHGPSRTLTQRAPTRSGTMRPCRRVPGPRCGSQSRRRRSGIPGTTSRGVWTTKRLTCCGGRIGRAPDRFCSSLPAARRGISHWLVAARLG
jgi:hypothetical protein